MKRKIVIGLFIIVIISCFVYVFYNLFKISKKQYINQNQNEERDNYIEKFAKQGKVEKFKGSGDESGYSGVIILNKDKLVKITTIDEFTGISSKLNSSINNIQIVSRDKDIFTLEYFKENKTFMNENFGIKTQSDFKKFMNYLGYEKNKEFKIQRCSIENAVNKGNSIYLDLMIDTRSLKVKVDIRNDEANNVKYNIHYTIP